MGFDGNNPQPLSSDDGFYTHPNWSPDGSMLTFNYRKADDSIPQIYISPVDKFSPHPLIDDKVPRIDADFSPDGKWLVYESWPEGLNHSLWLLSLDGKQQRKIPLVLEDIISEYSPSWRPIAGQSLIYH
jgi:Tol biopolymer transport system component